jgi:hypothetical protein
VITALSHFAWPFAVTMLAIAFKDQIAAQMSRMSSFKAAGTEATFVAQTTELIRSTRALPTTVYDSAAAERQAVLLKLAVSDPPEAVRQGWQLVREAAQAMARKRRLPWTTTQDLVVVLDEQGALDRATVQLILDLRATRYAMVGRAEQSMTASSATSYVTSAGIVANHLSQLTDDYNDTKRDS